jgi:hypothetical protein
MPLEISVYHKNDQADTIEIPVSVWQKGITRFDTTQFFKTKPSKVLIDSRLMLADINRLNNSSGLLPPVSFQFLVPRFIYKSNYIESLVDSYRIVHHPTLWYNSHDGVKVGYHLKGAFLKYWKTLDLEASIGVQSQNPGYHVEFANPLSSHDSRFSYFLGSREIEGRGRQELGLGFESFDSDTLPVVRARLSVSRNYLYDESYLFADGWSPGNVVTTDLVASKKSSLRFGEILIQGSLSMGTFASDYDFDRAAFGILARVKGIGFGETHFHFKAGKADGNVPLQRRFYLSSADPYDEWESPMFRSRGTLPDEWKARGHLFQPGGAGLSGYLSRGISGRRMISARVTNDLPVPRMPTGILFLSKQVQRIGAEAYFAGGKVWDPNDDIDILFELGAVISYDLPYLDLVLSESKLSLHLPFWLSDPSEGAGGLKWRWLFSLRS